MNKLIKLERKCSSLRPYHMSVILSMVIITALMYLLVFIPKLDPSEANSELFTSYYNLAGIANLLLMVDFTILSAVMSAKFIIEDYTGKRKALLFSYPVPRQKVLGAKMCLIFLYTAGAMFLCGTAVFGIFFLTESVAGICPDRLSLQTIIYCFFSLALYSLLAGVWGVIALWIGFGRQSVTAAIVAAVILSLVMCQFMSAVMNSLTGLLVLLLSGIIGAVTAWMNLKNKIVNMEVL